MKKIYTGCDDIYQRVQQGCLDRNERIAGLVVDEILSEINENFSFIKEDDTNLCKLSKIKNNYIYTSSYLDFFFEIMEKYGYNAKYEIINVISKLGGLANPSRNSSLINLFINSPYIEDITFDGKGKFKISSRQFGEINFKLASYYFRDNKKLTDYIANSSLAGRCHHHTLYLGEIFPQNYAITSLCTAYFGGKHYHSFSYNEKNGCVIDLCSNAFMDAREYKKIYEPDIISVVRNDDIDREFKITLRKTSQLPKRCKLLKIALYKQWLSDNTKDQSSKVLRLK